MKLLRAVAAAVVAGVVAVPLPAAAGPTDGATAGKPVAEAVQVARTGQVAAATTGGTYVVATDAPAKVRVGAFTQTVAVTGVAREPVTKGFAALADLDGTPWGLSLRVAAEPDRPTVFRPTVEFFSVDVPRWGAQRWVLGYTPVGAQDPVGDTFPVDVRANSVVDVTTSRSGSVVTATGRVRAFHSVAARYVGWPDRTVVLDRWTTQGWQRVTSVKADATGRFSQRVSIPRGTGLRWGVLDTPTIWGSVATRSV